MNTREKKTGADQGEQVLAAFGSSPFVGVVTQFFIRFDTFINEK